MSNRLMLAHFLSLLKIKTMPESYCHLFAKQLLVSWLRDRSRLIGDVPVEATGDSSQSFHLIYLDPIRALVPSDDPSKGVYEEYPVCAVEHGPTSLHVPWDSNAIPSYDELLARHQAPAYILDIAISHLGKIKYGIEVVYRHDVSPAKISGLQIMTVGLPFELYRVSAEWILNHCRSPNKLSMTQLIPITKRPFPFPSQTSIFA
jgi:hypothetical protein